MDQTDSAPSSASASMPTSESFHRIAISIADLVTKKNAAYGDSFNRCGQFLEILWPEGIPVAHYKNMLALVRVFDKAMRISRDKGAFGESPWTDILGYALLAVEAEERENLTAPENSATPALAGVAGGSKLDENL